MAYRVSAKLALRDGLSFIAGIMILSILLGRDSIKDYNKYLLNKSFLY